MKTFCAQVRYAGIASFMVEAKDVSEARKVAEHYFKSNNPAINEGYWDECFDSVVDVTDLDNEEW